MAKSRQASRPRQNRGQDTPKVFLSLPRYLGRYLGNASISIEVKECENIVGKACDGRLSTSR